MGTSALSARRLIQEGLHEHLDNQTSNESLDMVRSKVSGVLDMSNPCELATYLEENPEIKKEFIEMMLQGGERDTAIDEIFERDSFFIPDLLFCRNNPGASWIDSYLLKFPILYKAKSGHRLYIHILAIFEEAARNNPYITLVDENGEIQLSIDRKKIEKEIADNNPTGTYYDDDGNPDEYGEINEIESFIYHAGIMKSIEEVHKKIKELIKGLPNFQGIVLAGTTRSGKRQIELHNGNTAKIFTHESPSNRFIRTILEKFHMSTITKSI